MYHTSTHHDREQARWQAGEGYAAAREDRGYDNSNAILVGGAVGGGVRGDDPGAGGRRDEATQKEPTP